MVQAVEGTLASAALVGPSGCGRLGASVGHVVLPTRRNPRIRRFFIYGVLIPTISPLSPLPHGEDVLLLALAPLGIPHDGAEASDARIHSVP